MAISRTTTWTAGQVLTVSALNAEFNGIIDNARDLISPLTASLDMNGFEFILDADADSSITADTDDQIDFRVGAEDVFSILEDGRYRFTPQALSGTPAVSTGGYLNIAASTFTDNATAASGTATSWAAHAVQRPTLAATNTSVTTTDATTLYVANVPAAGTNETITNAWAAWFAGTAGTSTNVRIDGAMVLNPFGTSAGNTGELRCRELAANGTNYVGFKSADSLAANVIWTLPSADGTNTQVIQTNGSGVLSFAATTAAATQAEMETATSTTVYASPGRTRNHPGVAKAVAHFGVTGNILHSYGVTSVGDTGVGLATVTMSTAVSAANNQEIHVTCQADNVGGGRIGMVDSATAPTTTAFIAVCKNDGGTTVDPVEWYVTVDGDQ